MNLEIAESNIGTVLLGVMNEAVQYFHNYGSSIRRNRSNIMIGWQ